VKQARHLPVLLKEVLAVLDPGRLRGRPSLWLDGTLGLAGHSKAILEAAGEEARLLGCDRDPSALALAQAALAPYGTRVHLLRGTFEEVVDAAPAFLGGAAGFDGILLDLGLSSLQLDSAERGFSFRLRGPLDMRMDPESGPSAADWLAAASLDELKRVLKEYGEEREAGRLARAVLKARDEGRLTDTVALARVAEGVLGRPQPGRSHPATRLFQALRIAVNGELELLERALPKLGALLAPGGRLAVVSFHSLEDRRVKVWMRREATDCLCAPGLPECRCGHRARLRILTPKPLEADAAERAANPRARSAKLRCAERI
jgi:16S rRNA (cytosine1402-N4)-methyltransferase